MLSLKHISHITWTAANINSFPLQLLHCCNWTDTGWGFLERPIFQLKFNFKVKGFIENETLHAPQSCTVSEHEISCFIISRTVQEGRKSKRNKGRIMLFPNSLPSPGWNSHPGQHCRHVVRLAWCTMSWLNKEKAILPDFLPEWRQTGRKATKKMRGVRQAKWELLFYQVSLTTAWV